jgi:hypothetical protein
MTEFWDKPAEKSGKVLAAFLEGLPLVETLKILKANIADPDTDFFSFLFSFLEKS